MTSMVERPIHARGEQEKNAHFSCDGERERLASMGGLRVAKGAQLRAHGKLKKPLKAWLKRGRRCVCVCMHEEL